MAAAAMEHTADAWMGFVRKWIDIGPDIASLMNHTIGNIAANHRHWMQLWLLPNYGSLDIFFHSWPLSVRKCHVKGGSKYVEMGHPLLSWIIFLASMDLLKAFYFQLRQWLIQSFELPQLLENYFVSCMRLPNWLRFTLGTLPVLPWRWVKGYPGHQ